MKSYTKYLILTFICCVLTLGTQIIYHYTPQADSIGFISLARQYSAFKFFVPSLYSSQESGHLFYVVFLLLIGNIINYNQYIIGIVQTILFCISAFLLIKELEIYTHKKLTGLALIIILIPEINFFNGSIGTESIAYSLILLIFALGLKIHIQGATISRLLPLSLLLGTIILTRFEAATCIVAIYFLIFPKIKERLLLYSILLISFPVLLLCINGIKNYETFHVFRVTAFNGGETIYGGNNQNLDGSMHLYESHKDIFIPKNKIDDLNKILALPPPYYFIKRDSFYYQLAIEAWKKNPLQQIGVIPEKLAKNWLLPGMFDIYTNDTTKQRGLQIGKLLSKKYFQNAWYAPYKHLFYMLIHWFLLSIIIWGIVGIKKQNRFQVAVLVLLVFYLCNAIPFCGLPRFHAAIFPLLLIAFMPFYLVSKVNRIIFMIKTWARSHLTFLFP